MEKKEYLAPALEELIMEEEEIIAASEVPTEDEPGFGGEVDPGEVIPD